MLPLSIIDLKPLCPAIERSMPLTRRELSKNLEELEGRRTQNDASFPSYCITHTSSCIIVITRPKNKSTLRYLSAYGSPQSWHKVFLSERKHQSVPYRMPYTPGQHEAVPDEPLYTLKVHLLLSTFVQRLIEVLLLPKIMLLVFYSKSNFFSIL